MGIASWALKRPISTIMVFVSLSAIGIIASQLLPLQKWPDLEFPAVFIQVPYQGSTPEEVERLITRPIEEQVSTLGDIQRIRSESDQDGAFVFVFFGWGQNVDVKGVEVHDKIDAIRDQLPPDVERVWIGKFGLNDQPFLSLRLSGNRDLTQSYDLLDRNIKRRIERIDGVSKVEIYGAEQQEVRIQLLADRVAAYGIDLNQLVKRLSAANFSVSAGQITDGGSRFNVHPVGEFHDLDEIRRLPLGQGNVLLGDIAKVSLTQPEKTRGQHLDGKNAVGIAIYRENGANLVDVAERVTRELDKIRELPDMQGIKILYTDNQADGIKQSLRDLLYSGMVGALLSIIVLYLFLRQLTTTLMVTLAVPFSILITLAAMYFLGISLNILSMMGLMLAVGMLVDNAVVVSESIFRYRQLEPGDPFGAAIKGTREVGMAVMAGTLTTIIVFLPNLFGEQSNITIFLTQVAVAIVVALLASLAVAQTLIPMLSARLKPSARASRESRVMTAIKSRYLRLLNWFMLRRGLTTVLILLILVTAVVPAGLMKKDMFPDDSQRRLDLDYHLNGTYALPMVERNVDRIEQYLLDNRDKFDIDSVYSRFSNDWARTTILLREDGDDLKATEVVRDDITKSMPKLAIGAPGFGENRVGTDQGTRVQLLGDSTAVLAPLSKQVARILESVDGVATARSEVSAGQSEVEVTIDRDQALRHGLDTQRIASAISTALRGRNLRPFRRDTGELTTRIAFASTDSQTLEQLKGLMLYSSDGKRVRLDSVADFHVAPGPAEIVREDRKTTLGIDLTLEHGATQDQVNPRIKALMDGIKLPPGYSWSFGRGVRRAQDTQNTMVTNMLLAVALIYIVMAALFESVLHPAAIISSIIFSIIGVFWFFFFTGTVFSIMAMIGLLILMGLVVNNGIVMVDHINNLRREGHSRHEAILQGASDRLRPILMTVATTILGLLPLAVGGAQIGGDGPPYFPMARAIIGGLLFSSIVSLLMLPTIYTLLDDLGHWGKARWAKARSMRFLRGGEAG